MTISSIYTDPYMNIAHHIAGIADSRNHKLTYVAVSPVPFAGMWNTRVVLDGTPYDIQINGNSAVPPLDQLLTKFKELLDELEAPID